MILQKKNSLIFLEHLTWQNVTVTLLRLLFPPGNGPNKYGNKTFPHYYLVFTNLLFLELKTWLTESFFHPVPMKAQGRHKHFQLYEELNCIRKNWSICNSPALPKKVFFNSYNDQKQFTRPKHDSVFQLCFTPQLLHIKKVVKTSAAHFSTKRVFCTTVSPKPLQTDKGKGKCEIFSWDLLWQSIESGPENSILLSPALKETPLTTAAQRKYCPHQWPRLFILILKITVFHLIGF